MAQVQHTEQDAWSLAQKLDQFVQGLTPGEQQAWEALERHVSTLIPTEDADVQGYAFTPDQVTLMGQAQSEELRRQAAELGRAAEANRAGQSGTSDAGAPTQREGLWYRLMTTLNPPRRVTGDATS